MVEAHTVRCYSYEMALRHLATSRCLESDWRASVLRTLYIAEDRCCATRCHKNYESAMRSCKNLFVIGCHPDTPQRRNSFLSGHWSMVSEDVHSMEHSMGDDLLKLLELKIELCNRSAHENCSKSSFCCLKVIQIWKKNININTG